MKVNKKGESLYYKWVELWSLFLMFLGMIIAFLSESAIVNYMIISFSGFLVGRYYFLKKKGISFPFYIASVLYLIGFILGSIARQLDNFAWIIILTTAFYLVFIYIGKKVYKKKILRF